MKIILILSIICLAVVNMPAQNKEKNEDTRNIEGTVTDFFGVPWAGAKIELRAKGVIYNSSNVDNESRFKNETKTDNNGKYIFTDLPEDSYEITLLRIDNIGTLEEAKQTGVLFDKKTYKIDFAVEVGASSECQYSINGIVKDEKGNVLEGAKISVFSAFNQRRFLSSVSDKKGVYDIRVCSLGDYIVFVNTPKYEVQTTNIIFQTWNDNIKNVSFTLKPLSEKRLNWRN